MTMSLDLVLALVGVLAQREADVVEQVHRAEQRAVLEQDAELLAHLEQVVVGHVRDRLAVDEHVAVVGVEQADHVLDAHGLAGARRAEDHRDLALGDAHVQAAQDLVAAERLVDVDELDGVRHAGRALRARVPLVLVVGVAARAWPARSRARSCGSSLLGRRLRVRAAAPRGWLRRAAAARPAAAAARLLRRRLLRVRLLVVSSSCCRRSVPCRLRSTSDGARGLAPQKSCVPSIPMRCTSTMFSTIDFAVAVPTPTGPPLAL